MGSRQCAAAGLARRKRLLAKMSALGITPGTSLKLVQKWPAFVLQCDETEVALEEEIAKHIYVWQTQRE